MYNLTFLDAVFQSVNEAAQEWGDCYTTRYWYVLYGDTLCVYERYGGILNVLVFDMDWWTKQLLVEFVEMLHDESDVYIDARVAIYSVDERNSSTIRVRRGSINDD